MNASLTIYIVVVVVVFDDTWVVDVFGFVVAPVGVAVVFSERPECKTPNGFVEKMRMIEMKMNMRTRMRLRRKMRVRTRLRLRMRRRMRTPFLLMMTLMKRRRHFRWPPHEGG